MLQVFGLPLHPLVVHAVVVLVPLAVVTGIVVACWPAARRRYGWAVLVLTGMALVSIPLATSSGEELEHNIAGSDLIRAHAHLGDQLLVFVAALFATLLAVLLLDRRRDRLPRWPALLAAVLVVASATVSAVQVVRIGDSGARAAWSDTRYVQSASGSEEDDDG
ncbi:DUF2231 domain-containing protein [Actinokineospora bangkokensis]|uniref:DUF2231 domain-containing protein n=1 Tax=Actinokineospora bangkokensis TaxID=1193682 RepID=A0A1Q9LQX1_9PSEU|nr:DUF2231 domain-containing protein [Actinokineospora bangkokensis]OLR94447.1 hypothetical protein BJP25_11890 [Actinokineospora bangkokensis]